MIMIDSQTYYLLYLSIDLGCKRVDASRSLLKMMYDASVVNQDMGCVMDVQ